MSRAWLWLGLLVAFTGSAKELVLVDADLATQIQAKPGVELRRLHGLDDLPDALAGDRWSRVSLISHGQSGALQLGGERLDLAFLAQHPGFLNAWRQQLTTNAQLELWGCAVAKDQGHQLVDSLSTSIGRPVLASTDATGPSRLGGNQSLEYGHGRVPDRTPLAGLQQLLVADLTVANSEGFDSCENCVDNTSYPVATVFGSFKVFASPNNSLAVAPAGEFSPTQSLLVIANNIGDVTMIRVASSGGSGDVGNGGHFRLKSLNLKGNYTGGYSTDVLIHAFRNGTEIGTGTPLDLLTPKVFDLSSNVNFYDIDAFTITGPDLVIWMDDIMVDAPLILKDSDGSLAAGDGTELSSIATTAGATAALDFKLTDGGTSDGLAMEVSQVKVHVSGTSTDAERGNVVWTLTGPDITGSVSGTYDGATDIVTFNPPINQAISIANGGSETYTVNANLGHSGLIEGNTFILSLDGDTDLTLDRGGTRMASTSAVNNGSGFATSVTASQLAFTTQPAGSISGSALTTQPVVAAQDSYGNTDVGFTNNISLSEGSAGSLSGISTVAASSGVATFTNLLYTATADQEAFILTAAASGLTGTSATSVTSDVVATKLLFNTQPAPTSISSGSTTNFSTVPVLKAVDANNTVDTGYSTNMVLSVSNTSGGAVAGTVNSLTATGDTDGSATTVTLTPTSGSATVSGLALNYTNAGISDSLALRAASGSLSAAISSTLTSLALPTVSDARISISGASGTGGAFKVGDTVTATWNNTSGGDNNSGITGVTVDFSQFGGGVAVTASNSGETWSATYIITSGSIDATSRNISVSATNVNGTGTSADTSNATVDNQAPTVSDARISLNGASGTGGVFKVGDTVTATWNNTASGDNNGDISAVTVDFSAFGGGAAVVANNSGGTWTATYTLIAGTIADTNRNVSVAVSDNAGNTTTTADTTNASVDSQTPTVTDARISISGASGTGGAFKIGDTVTATWNNTASGDNNGDISSVSVDFSGFGGGSTVAASNSAGTWTVTYLLTAGAIDASNRNVSITVTDNAGNTTTTADTSNATVDNVAPTVSDARISISGATGIGGVFKVGDTVTATWNNTASGDNNSDVSAVTVDFSAFDGGSAVTASNSGGTWTAVHALGAGVANGSNRNVSVTVSDNAGNSNTSADTSNGIVDTTAPTVTTVAVPANDIYTTGQSLDFTVNFDKAVTVTGTPRLALTLGSGTVYADYLSGSGSSALIFRHAVQAGENDSDGLAVGALGLNSGTIKDAVGNDATLTLNSVASTSSVLVDTSAPTVTTVEVPVNGTYTTGQSLDFTANFDEAVTVTGTPRLALTLGSSTVYADYLSGSGSSVLTFRHTVQAGGNDADGIAVGALGLNSGTIKDAAGNDASLTLNSVASTSGVLVDTSAPTVNSVAVPANGTYITGQDLDFTVNFDEAVTVTGTPRLALMLGSSTVYADYFSGSGSSALIFRHAVQAGENDADGIAVGALGLNSGTLRDGAGNNATLTLNGVSSTSAVLVDGVAPTLLSSSPADNSTGVAFDANVQLVLSEAITAGSGTLAIYDVADDSLVEANTVGSSRVTISGNTVTLDPQANLIPSHSYYLQVGAQVLLDAAGNAYAGISDKTTLHFTVANVAPVAQADSASTQEDSAVQVDVTANDSDADSALNKASVTVVTAAQHGTTSVDTGTGVISYTPASNYNGSDSFSYRVQDIYGANSNVVTVSVMVQPVNDAPLAVADIASTTEDAALMLDVLANDSDIDSGDSLNPATLTLVTSPAHGTAQISHGQVSYTPAANFNGSDAFSYTVADQHGAISNAATVMINVGSSNDTPVAANDTASTDEDHAVSVDVRANDSDMDGTLVPASVALLQQPAHGQVMLNGATGALVYTPAANYFGQDSFSYVVQDNEGATSNAASVTVTVNSINDAPVATNNSVTLQEDASLSINVLGNDSDVDGTLVPASVQLVSQPAHGSATVSNTDGSVLYIPTSNAVGDDSFSYRVQDDQGVWSNVATVTMTIQSVNDAPLANADQGDLDEDGALTLHLLDNDSDVDGSLQDVHIITQPTSGSLDVGSNGAVTYTPAVNFHGSDSFRYQAVDNQGARSPSAVVTLTVRAVNDAPTITGNGTATLLEGDRYHFAPVINDVDGDELTVTASGLPQWLSINSRTGELSGTPVVGQAGQYDAIVLTVSDGMAQSALPAFALTVQADLDGDGLANTVDADDDNDGMSDGYEDDHDFNPLDPADATTDADQDGVSNQQESVDGTNPHNASDYLDTTAPVVSAVADVTVDATGLFTPVTVRKLLGQADTVSDEEVATELRALSSDNMDGAACCSVTIDGMTDNQLLLAPGRHEVVYQASDRKGNIGTVTQQVRVRPLVSMSKDQVAVPGQSLSFSIILNGPAPDYPFTVPYVIDDTSTLPAAQHSLQAGSVTFTAAETALTVPVTLGADAAASGDQTLVVRLDDHTSDDKDLAGGYDPMAPDSHDINAGAKRTHAITVTAGNVAPQIELSLQQNGQQTMLVTPNGGSVTVTATVQDPNATDTHSFDWSGTAAEVVDTDENLTDAVLVFEPTDLAEGIYPVQVAVTDSQGAAAVRTLYFRLVASLPELAASADTDGDGISDPEEGVADSDDDGIIDYLDNLSASNLLPEALATTAGFVMECEPGVLCRLGQYALRNGTSGSRILASELALQPNVAQDGGFTPVGGIFDFEIADLPTAGQSVSVVIPLGEAIPVNAVYRKFQNGQWRTFVADSNNQLHSAPGSLGYCPPPGDVQWTAGLTAGSYCVQLTLEDGGPNDADGVVNASIADPGAVSVSTADDTAEDEDGSGSVGGAGLLALWALQRYRRRERAKLQY